MLDKIKRFFSLNVPESQETIVNVRNCYRLKTVNYTNPTLKAYKLVYKDCGATIENQIPLNNASGSINVDKCIVSNSMEEYIINGFGDRAVFITATQIQNAILYNNGVIEFTTLFGDTIVLEFGYCRSTSPSNLVEEGLISSRSSSSNIGICDYELPNTVYFKNIFTGQINTGTLVYTNSIGTIVFNGSNVWWKVQLPSQNPYSVRIQNGEIIEISFCL